MPHDTPLITTIVAALVLAYIFGAIANRLKMPPLVGYLIAGVCVGPHSPGFVADQTLAPQLAEIGVILLMFGVGLEFSLRDLLSVKAVAIPGALIRLAVTTALGIGFGTLLHWPLLGGVVLGLALGVSSTVVTLKSMQDRHLMDSDRGRIAIGWLVVEDLAMVLALVLIPAFAGAAGTAASEGIASAAAAAQTDPFVALTEQVLHTQVPLWGVLAVVLVKLLAFVGFMIVVGRRIIPFILHATAHTGSRELFRLAVLAIALGVAAGAAYLFGVSLALGAFFAGMILSESELSHRAAQETLPLRDAFGVLFFVSVGMLFDPTIIVREPLPVLGALAIILFGKSIVGFLLLVLFRRPVGAALTITAALAQIGEFSFILIALGIALGVMPEEGRGLILAGAIISIILNPLMFWLSERLRPRFEQKAARRTEPDLELGPVVPDHVDDAVPHPAVDDEVLGEMQQATRLSNHVVLIGYGRVGSVVAEELNQEGAPFVLVEDAEGRVRKARDAGIEVIVGNAALRETLTLANVMSARCVVIAIPNAFEAGQATEQCRKLNAGVRIIARAHSDEETEYLRRLGADEVIMGEREIGLGMIDWLKGQATGGGRRETAGGRLSSKENLLQQVRQGQPSATVDRPLAGPPMLLEPVIAASPPESMAPQSPRVEPILPPAAAIRAALAENVIEFPATTPARDVPDAPVPEAPVSVESRPNITVEQPVVREPAPVAAVAPEADDRAAVEASVLGVLDGYRPDRFVVFDAAHGEADQVVPAARDVPGPAESTTSPEAAAETSAERPAEAMPAAVPDLGIASAPPAAMPDGTAAQAAADDTGYETPAPPAESNSVAGPQRDREPASAATAEAADVVEVQNVTEEPVEPITPPEPVSNGPAVVHWGTEVPPVEPPSAPAWVKDADTSGLSEERPPAFRSPGFRVVPPSDIIILPPDPSARTGAWGGADEKAGEAPPAFRSEFWGDPANVDGDEFDTANEEAHPAAPLRDVRENAAARAAVEDGSWIAALERDLFGDGLATAPVDEAQATTSRPNEPAQPPEAAPSRGQQQPATEPVERPETLGVTPPHQQPGRAPAVAPERRAEESDATEASVDSLGRKEPRLY